MCSGPSMKASWIAGVASTAPIGMTPLVSPLARRHDVGHDVEIVGAERRAEPAEAGDHLVEDQQDAVLLGDLAQLLEIALGRDQHARRAGHRLDDHRRDGRGIVQRDDPLELVGELRAVLGSPRVNALSLRLSVCGMWSTPVSSVPNILRL